MVATNINTFSPATLATRSPAVTPTLDKRSRVIVVGAGAFGGWTALYLLRKGYRVTLIDAWGPGNTRSSSGDETRVIRSTYGDNETYFDLNVRALQLWKENEKIFNTPLFYNTGVLWFCYQEKTPIVDDSIPFAQKHGMAYEYLSREALAKRFPQVYTEDLHHAYFDAYGGYLKARESCQAVYRAFIKEGGQTLQAYVKPPVITHGNLSGIVLADNTELHADVYMFCCGPWLGTLFPDVLGGQIVCTKQEVYYFGTPAAHASAYENLPVWVDVDGQDFYYGIAGNGHRGFKIGVDKRGQSFDPSTDARTMNADVFAHAYRFLQHRFPQLTNAPLLEARVCPYENSPDGNFIFGPHPDAANVLFLGGGSGHGFKHGPALGERIARVMAGEDTVPNDFRQV